MAIGLPTWIIVALVLFLVLLIIFKTMNQVYLLSLIKKHFFWFFAIALFIFLAISVTYIHSTNDIDFSSAEGIKAAGKIYLSWAANVISNIGKVTGYAAQQSWVNSTK